MSHLQAAPYQVTCCGNSFCRACIQRIEAENKVCPTCNKENFESYHDKCLQHQLYELKVFCSNKKIGRESWGNSMITSTRILTRKNGQLAVLTKILNVYFARNYP